MNLGSLFTTIGETGNQYANAKTLAYNERLQKILDQLGVKQAGTNLSESEERLRRLKAQPENPEDAKFQQTLAAFRNAFKREPTEQEKQVLFGLPTQQSTVKTPFELALKQDPNLTYEKWQKMQNEGKEELKGWTRASGNLLGVKSPDGKEYFDEESIPAEEGKKLFRSLQKSEKASEENKATVEARKNAEALARALAIGDAREAEKQRAEVAKVARRGISGHAFLKTIVQQVNDAEASGGVGNKWGDMLIAEGFMQLMFGVDPKALRGSPKMMEFLLNKQGGWDDRMIAEMNKAINGGQMSQAVRKQALEQAQLQIQSWDEQIRQTGQLVDDLKTKALMDKYFKSVSGTDDAEAKALGGRPQ